MDDFLLKEIELFDKIKKIFSDFLNSIDYSSKNFLYFVEELINEMIDADKVKKHLISEIFNNLSNFHKKNSLLLLWMFLGKILILINLI